MAGADRHLEMADRQALADPEAEAIEQDGINGGAFIAANGSRKGEPIRQGDAPDQGIRRGPPP